jgi:hypothetical protein
MLRVIAGYIQDRLYPGYIQDTHIAYPHSPLLDMQLSCFNVRDIPRVRSGTAMKRLQLKTELGLIGLVKFPFHKWHIKYLKLFYAIIPDGYEHMKFAFE